MKRSLLSMIIFVASCGESAGGPTYHGDIAPILDRSCSGCHHDFDAAGATRRAARIAEMVVSGRMPPWLPSGGSYSNDPRPTPAEKTTLVAWARDPQVGIPRRRMLPTAGEVYETEPHAIGDADEIWCFLVRPPPGFVVGYRWTGIGAHHFQADTIGPALATVAEAKGGARGWPCADTQLDLPGKTSLISTNPLVPYRYPLGYGVELAPGDAIVLYVHLTPQPDRSPRRFGIALEYGAAGKPIIQFGWGAPSEVPCPPALAGQPQCQQAYARSRALLGDGLPTPQEQVARCGPQTFEPSPDGQNMIVRSQCSQPLPPGRWRLLGIRLHMHLRGLAGTVSTAGRLLLNIPAWDYRFEDTYAPAEPIELGSEVTSTCVWRADARYHTFELGRDGEMCVASVSLGEML